MQIEQKLKQEIVSELSDTDAKRAPEWVSSWLGALFDAYEKMPKKGLLDEYEKTIEPFVFWLTPESRRWLGEALWQDRRGWQTNHSIEELYPLTGLASYLAPQISGS